MVWPGNYPIGGIHPFLFLLFPYLHGVMAACAGGAPAGASGGGALPYLTSLGGPMASSGGGPVSRGPGSMLLVQAAKVVSAHAASVGDQLLGVPLHVAAGLPAEAVLVLQVGWSYVLKLPYGVHCVMDCDTFLVRMLWLWLGARYSVLGPVCLGCRLPQKPVSEARSHVCS